MFSLFLALISYCPSTSPFPPSPASMTKKKKVFCVHCMSFQSTYMTPRRFSARVQLGRGRGTEPWAVECQQKRWKPLPHQALETSYVIPGCLLFPLAVTLGAIRSRRCGRAACPMWAVTRMTNFYSVKPRTC